MKCGEIGPDQHWLAVEAREKEANCDDDDSIRD